MIYLFTAIGLTPGDSSTVHIYTQTVHRTTQSTQTIHRTTQLTGKCAGRGPSLRVIGLTLAFALQLNKKHGKTSVRVAEESTLSTEVRKSISLLGYDAVCSGIIVP